MTTTKLLDVAIYEQLSAMIEFRDGEPYWTRDSRCGRIRIGSAAGSVVSHGYRVIRFMNKAIYAHRLMWYMAYGYVPRILDHVNHDRADNRIENLREATYSQNQRNIVKRTGSSRFIGPTWDKKQRKWRSQITVNGKQQKLGAFENEEDAAIARDVAVIENGLEAWSPLNFPGDFAVIPQPSKQ